ncbi:hypothetical protein [Bradyrhizobium sp. CB3481]|uniref:hypothetical protein n=1 Tax=Bradyrhizobium sp. CB3481 TaxID=3039158 RepID=UPI0024B27D3B|nr:hypothetical protein [Bradyrhizobium sp. CB3481]WFU18487.1 hypothetical protein QA643_09125 [Bradyrhizobium sp. CB3481]
MKALGGWRIKRRTVHVSRLLGDQTSRLQSYRRLWANQRGPRRGKRSLEIIGHLAIADTNQKNGERRVLDQMAVAAKTLGWPAQVVDAARSQLKNVAEMQVETMDLMMDAWEEQLKLPNPTASPAGMLSKLTSSPSLTSTAAGTPNPIEVWMKLAEQWQRTWTDTFSATGKRQ